MIIKTSELECAALDWAVAVIEGHGMGFAKSVETNGYCPSKSWGQAGRLIEKYKLTLYQANGPAAIFNDDTNEVNYDGRKMVCADGDTILQAAMRAIVASELGDTVDVPEELVK